MSKDNWDIFLPLLMPFTTVGILGGVTRGLVLLIATDSNGKPKHGKRKIIFEMLFANITCILTAQVLNHYGVSQNLIAPISVTFAILGYHGWVVIAKQVIKKITGVDLDDSDFQ